MNIPGSGWFNRQQTWLQWVIILVVLGIVATIVFAIIRWAKNQKRKNLFKDDYDNLVAQGQKPSYPQTSYLQMADKIDEAGCPYGYWTACSGTDEEAILSPFNQMNNALDVLLLVKAFGKRTARGTTSTTTYDLGGFLATELDAEKIDEINEILSKRGINYRF